MAVSGVHHQEIDALLDQERGSPSASAPTPTAAPTRNRPRASLVALGNWIFFWMSLTVINPVK